MMPATAAAKRARYAHGIQLPRVADGRTQTAKRFRAPDTFSSDPARLTEFLQAKRKRL
jgi:hypothetical protein